MSVYAQPMSAAATQMQELRNALAPCCEPLRHTPVDAGALRAAERACDLAPDDPRAWADRGRMHALLGQWHEAVIAFSHALRVDAHCVDAWHHLGAALSRLGHHIGALIAFENALWLDATRAPTHLALGNLLFETGQLEAALKCFDRAAAHDPNLTSSPLESNNC